MRVALVLKKPVLKNLKLLCDIGWKWRHISFKWHFEPLYLILSAHQSWRKSLQYHYFPSSRAEWKIQCQRTLWAVSRGPLSSGLSGLCVMPGSLSSTFSSEGITEETWPKLCQMPSIKAVDCDIRPCCYQLSSQWKPRQYLIGHFSPQLGVWLVKGLSSCPLIGHWPMSSPGSRPN